MAEAGNRLFEREDYIKKLEEQLEYYQAVHGSRSVNALFDEEVNSAKGMLAKREKVTAKNVKEGEKFKDVLDYLKYCNIGNEKQSSFIDFTNHYIQLERDFAELKKENEKLFSKLNSPKKVSTHILTNRE